MTPLAAEERRTARKGDGAPTCRGNLRSNARPPPRGHHRRAECATAAAGSALRPIRRLVEAAVAQTTWTEQEPEVECQEGEGPSQIHHPCLSHVIHLLSSPRT